MLIRLYSNLTDFAGNCWCSQIQNDNLKDLGSYWYSQKSFSNLLVCRYIRNQKETV
jgi:hypothetical protein